MDGWKIYALKDPRDGEIRYIGRTLDVKRRYNGHLAPSQLTDSQKCRWIRQLRDLGLKPMLEILEAGAGDSVQTERDWIAKLKAEGANLTNGNDGAGGLVGYTHSAETRQKLCEARRHIIVTAEWKANISNGLKGHRVSQRVVEFARNLNLGKKLSQETRRKLSEARTPAMREMSARYGRARKGVPHSPEAKAKISAGNLGKVLSPDVKRRIGEANKGKVRSEETKRKLSAAQRARAPHSQQTRAKIIAALTGRPVSEASRAKMSASRTAYYQKKRDARQG